MTAVAFDTLRFSQRLVEAGLTSTQAAGISAATAEAMGELVGQLATRHDHAMLRQELKADAEALRHELKADADALRHELKAEFAAFRQEVRSDAAALREELKADVSGLQRDMERLELRMTVKLGTMIAGAVVLTAALNRLL